MATGSATHSYHSTIAVASTVETVTLAESYTVVEVINRSGSAEIYFTLDGSVPTVGGSNTYVLPAAITSTTANNGQSDLNLCVVNLVSIGTPTYSVVGVSLSEET